MLESNSSRDLAVLDSADAATFVTTAASSRFFMPFLGRERFPSDVARELGVEIGSVTYRISQMLKFGLLSQSRTVPRAGRSMRAYRAPFDSVFAPMELTPIPTLSALFAQSRVPSERALRQAIEKAWLRVGRDSDWGTHLYRPVKDADVNRDFVPLHMAQASSFWEAVLSEGKPAVWDQLTTLRLTRTAAKSLQHDLAGLIERHRSSHDSDEHSMPHLIHLAMAPHEPPH